MHNREKETMA